MRFYFQFIRCSISLATKNLGSMSMGSEWCSGVWNTFFVYIVYNGLRRLPKVDMSWVERIPTSTHSRSVHMLLQVINIGVSLFVQSVGNWDDSSLANPCACACAWPRTGSRLVDNARYVWLAKCVFFLFTLDRKMPFTTLSITCENMTGGVLPYPGKATCAFALFVVILVEAEWIAINYRNLVQGTSSGTIEIFRLERGETS